jgi:hypothetical protein
MQSNLRAQAEIQAQRKKVSLSRPAAPVRWLCAARCSRLLRLCFARRHARVLAQGAVFAETEK